MLHSARIAPACHIRLRPELHDKRPVRGQQRFGLEFPVGFCPWVTISVTLSETKGLSERFFALFRMTIVGGHVGQCANVSGSIEISPALG
jgi:hypothetical protein